MELLLQNISEVLILRYKFYKKLDDVEKEISVNYSIPFIRIHKSYLVNFQQIRKVGYTEVETKDGRILNISDTYKKDVRALKCVSRRYIHIKIIYRKENLFIKISNSFDGKVKKDRHGHLISMKSDLTRYGLGLALIEKSVNKYNGLLNFDIDEENFTLTVLLYS